MDAVIPDYGTEVVIVIIERIDVRIVTGFNEVIERTLVKLVSTVGVYRVP